MVSKLNLVETDEEQGYSYNDVGSIQSTEATQQNVENQPSAGPPVCAEGWCMHAFCCIMPVCSNFVSLCLHVWYLDVAYVCVLLDMHLHI